MDAWKVDRQTLLLSLAGGLAGVWVCQRLYRFWKFVSAIEQLEGAPFKFPSG